MKYRKKPVVIEAIQLLDDDKSIREVQNFIDNKSKEISNIGTSIMDMDYWDRYLEIVRKQGGIRLKTLESDNETQIASFGDFLIKGVQGEFYPCKPDIFEKTYEPADDYNISKNSLPSSSVTGESEAIGERTFSLKEIQDILDDYCKVLLSDISNTFLHPDNQMKAAMLTSSAVLKAIGEKITTFPLPDKKEYFKDKFGIDI